MQAGGYAIDILVQGYPGKATHHGGLGWSTIVLLRGHGRVALVDAGSVGMRKLLVEQLRQRGLRPADITDLILSHSHHDHSVNWPLFRHARIVIGARELEWSLNEPWGETPVPEFTVRALASWPTLQKVGDGDEVLPGITAHLAPGHTPGHLIFVIAGEEHDVIILEDAVKNRAELVSRRTDMTYDPAVSAATVEMVWTLWRRRPGSIVIPGHDLPMVQENGRCRYLTERSAGIEARLSDDFDAPTVFNLTG
jgi:glyoxylase-like metal-dependent hydrolase (beta-lactamase superfamily II)